MLFNSYVFLFAFLPLLLLVYYGALSSMRARNAWLTVMSYAFYGWWNPWFALLMLGSTASDYIIGRALYRAPSPRRKKLLLIATIILNLSVLGFFKYYNFFARSLDGALGLLSLPPILPELQIILPIGISFYTFESLSYTIDIYRGEVKPATEFLDFLCFISLFPHLVAGPIMRYSDLDRQLRDRTHSLDKIKLGLIFVGTGLLKKLALADTVAPLADYAFGSNDVSTLSAWIGAIAYAMQIYFDFSGYSDMAYGLGLMIGFDLVQNFDSPYQATSITDFWRKWHISLSSWLRDYLYVPLGGNRKGVGRTYVNLIIVMFLGGLWHGASWTFVVWGLYHGSLLALERWLGNRNPIKALPLTLQRLVTFLLVLIGWIMFRAVDFESAARVLGSLVGIVATDAAGVRGALGMQAGVGLLLCVIVAFMLPNLRRRLPPVTPTTGFLAGIAFSTAILLIAARATSPFLYFQF